MKNREKAHRSCLGRVATCSMLSLKRALVTSTEACIYACVGKPEKVTGLAVPQVSLSLADFQSWTSAEETEIQEVLLRHLLAMRNTRTSPRIFRSPLIWLVAVASILTLPLRLCRAALSTRPLLKHDAILPMMPIAQSQMFARSSNLCSKTIDVPTFQVPKSFTQLKDVAIYSGTCCYLRAAMICADYVH